MLMKTKIKNKKNQFNFKLKKQAKKIKMTKMKKKLLTH